MNLNLHPTAHVARGAELGNGVIVGPHAIIGENVKIGDDCEIGAGVYIDGWTTLGARNRISPYAVLGTPPQDLKFAGGKTFLTIGSDNVIKEFVTINRATEHGGGVTQVGNHNFIMAYSHIAHDCLVGNNNILANAATLAGHILVEDNVTIGGLTGIHQFVSLGSYSFIGGCSAISQDILPFALAAGNHAVIRGLNRIGLTRQGFSSERLDILKKAFRVLLRSQFNRRQAIDHLKENFELTPDIQHLLGFVEKSRRGFAKSARPKIMDADEPAE